MQKDLFPSILFGILKILISFSNIRQKMVKTLHFLDLLILQEKIRTKNCYTKTFQWGLVSCESSKAIASQIQKLKISQVCVSETSANKMVCFGDFNFANIV